MLELSWRARHNLTQYQFLKSALSQHKLKDWWFAQFLYLGERELLQIAEQIDYEFSDVDELQSE